MKNPVNPLFSLLLVASIVGLLACEDEDVGLPCTVDESGTDTTDVTDVNSEAMECRSRLCLKVGGQKPLCTRTCDSDSDCPDGTASCRAGFTCIAPLETTSLKCCKMCVCKDPEKLPEDAGDSAICQAEPNPTCPDSL